MALHTLGRQAGYEAAVKELKDRWGDRWLGAITPQVSGVFLVRKYEFMDSSITVDFWQEGFKAIYSRKYTIIVYTAIV